MVSFTILCLGSDNEGIQSRMQLLAFDEHKASDNVRSSLFLLECQQEVDSAHEGVQVGPESAATRERGRVEDCLAHSFELRVGEVAASLVEQGGNDVERLLWDIVDVDLHVLLHLEQQRAEVSAIGVCPFGELDGVRSWIHGLHSQDAGFQEALGGRQLVFVIPELDGVLSKVALS